MSGNPKEIGYAQKAKNNISTCKFCQEMILWGHKFGKKHPFDVAFDDDGNPKKAGSHMDTCPQWKTGGLKAKADANTEAILRWRESCETSAHSENIDAHTFEDFERFEVPEKHAIPIASKLRERGGPFDAWHTVHLLPHFKEIAVQEGVVKAVFLTPAIYNRIHDHLHGFAMSLFSDMAEREPVTVAGYKLGSNL